MNEWINGNTLPLLLQLLLPVQCKSSKDVHNNMENKKEESESLKIAQTFQKTNEKDQVAYV